MNSVHESESRLLLNLCTNSPSSAECDRVVSCGTPGELAALMRGGLEGGVGLDRRVDVPWPTSQATWSVMNWVIWAFSDPIRCLCVLARLQRSKHLPRKCQLRQS